MQYIDSAVSQDTVHSTCIQAANKPLLKVISAISMGFPGYFCSKNRMDIAPIKFVNAISLV
jgi:hypothetical protein